MTESGQHLDTTRIDNDLLTPAQQMARWGEDPQVVLEATYGWYWAVDVPSEHSAETHLAHPRSAR